MTPQDAHLIQLTLDAPIGAVSATVNALGARQVSLSMNGRQALQPYDVTKLPPYATGFTMAPWANRMRDGKWRDGEKTFTNPITEARTNTALHGLLLDTVYEVAHQTASSVTFRTVLLPSDGYPFEVQIEVEYQLVADGLTVAHRAINRSNHPAPYGTGAHPYLYFEGIKTADLELHLPAASWTRVDDRLLPVATESVRTFPTSGTEIATGGWVRLGDFCIDNDFLDLTRGADGLARTVLRAPSTSADHRITEVWQDSAFSHVHVFSCDFYPSESEEFQHGITIEPVTAGPDAFNTGLDLIQLSPGEEWCGSWGIRLLNW